MSRRGSRRNSLRPARPPGHERILLLPTEHYYKTGKASMIPWPRWLPRPGIIVCAVLSFLLQQVLQVFGRDEDENNRAATSRSAGSTGGALQSSSRTKKQHVKYAECQHRYTDYRPDFFDCEGSPSWDAFMDLVRQAAKLKFQMIPPELYNMAHKIIEIWDAKPYPPQDFHNMLCDPRKVWNPLHAEEYQPFCLYGFIYALLIRARVFMSEGSKDLVKMAKEDLSYAVTCLGKEGSVDFLDSSAVGATILDFYINIGETEFYTYDEYVKKFPVPEPPPDEFGMLHYNPQPPLEEQQLHKLFFHEDRRRTLHAAVFGTHATLSLETVHMVQEFVLRDQVELKPVFYGLEPRWCGILGMCNRGDPAFAKFFKDAEQDPYGDDFTWEKMEQQIEAVYFRDEELKKSDFLLCTEPLVGCLLLQKLWRERMQKTLPVLGYLGVALLNSVPPLDLVKFWDLLDGRKPGTDTILYVNNRILREQIYYQTGIVAPYVRAHGLYTKSVYSPQIDRVLFWRAPLFVYPTLRCAIWQFLKAMRDRPASPATTALGELPSPEGEVAGKPSTSSDDNPDVSNSKFPFTIRFLDEKESMDYSVVAQHRSVILLPWDHALMTFYELYSMSVPLFLPKIEWIYRFVYQRGQLSVGEPLYQSVHPRHKRPRAKFASYDYPEPTDNSTNKESVGPMSVQTGLSSAKAARGVTEDMLRRGLDENLGLVEVRAYMVAALDLIMDMQYFLTAAENKTTEADSYTSAGKVKRYTKANRDQLDLQSIEYSDEPWHPYTPFQMSPRDSNEWNRMRKGGWWLRRGVRVDAMRYWFQYSDFYRFPALQYFDNIPDLFCRLQSADLPWITNAMHKYNDETLLESTQYWTDAVVRLLS
ncbi:unnamed protein product [Amoebophrya sp. A120]|nr:unnamed protein product [Amoebophrya sp. A120]|eukprot:GSA120T00018155001.1